MDITIVKRMCAKSETTKSVILEQEEAKEGKQDQSSEPQVMIPKPKENKPGLIPGTSKDWPECSSKMLDAPTTFSHDKGADIQIVTRTPESNIEEINSNPDNTNIENVELKCEIL